MNGLDLFSGIGGLTKALAGYVTPVAYCENDRYAQAVLLSRMSDGSLPTAPIWDDVTTLGGWMLPSLDIIYGGFPCQDISVAGRGAGLGGERSGLFFEIARLVGELRPSFVFLENVSAITRRGGDIVVGTLADLGYDCRWDVLSAADVGANHKRERWWLLAHASSFRRRGGKESEGKRSETSQISRAISNSEGERTGAVSAGWWSQGQGEANIDGNCQELGHANGKSRTATGDTRTGWPESGHPSWWAIEPPVGRVVNGLPMRVDRLRGLGNSVVPAQAREAFERLMGVKK